MGIFGGSPQDQVDFDHLQERVTKLEAALSSLQAQVSGLLATRGSAPVAGAALSSDPDWLDEVRRLKHDGNLIQAIKAYRENTGLGLKEAKDAVEAMP